MTATHTWAVLGVTRFTPSPTSSSYICTVNWKLTTELGERTATRTAATTFGPDYPGSADLNLPQLVDLIRSPEIERELEAELGATPVPPPSPEPPRRPRVKKERRLTPAQ